MNASSPSLMIPFAHGNISKKRVQRSLEDVGFGKIKQIDEVSRVNEHTGKKSKRFFVHFTAWESGWDELRERLMSSQDEFVEVVYDEPWYWKIRACSEKFAGGYTKDNNPSADKPKKKAFIKSAPSKANDACDVAKPIQIIISRDGTPESEPEVVANPLSIQVDATPDSNGD